MALPFVLGLALGAGAVIAFNKSDKIKKIVNSGIDKTKQNVEELKDNLNATKECIKNKKDELKKKLKEELDETIND